MAKSRSNTPAATARVAWWLGAGDEECPHCGHLYIYELEFRCPECDGPGCSHCAQVHAEGHKVCPGCVEPAAVTQRETRRRG